MERSRIMGKNTPTCTPRHKEASTSSFHMHTGHSSSAEAAHLTAVAPFTAIVFRPFADLGLEGVAELGDERQEDGAAEAQRVRVGRRAVLQQAEAQVVLDAVGELLAGRKHAAAVLQQHLQQLERQHLRRQQALDSARSDAKRACPATAGLHQPAVDWYCMC